ncbi:pyrimidine 5'-nucleotidase-like protein [Aureococcus anophagefferens]|nr:pyrimidine 5'-nucleotidase-like protein [Aureococcus anophagefferens]
METALALAGVGGVAYWASRKRRRGDDVDDASLAASKRVVARLLCDGHGIADVEACTAKLAALIAGGAGKLTVVADFDRTLTTADSASAHGVLAKALPDAQKTEKELFAHYYPIEGPGHAAGEENSAHDGVVREKPRGDGEVRADAGEDGRRRARRPPRPSCGRRHRALDLLETAGVKLQVFSAGVGDVIDVALEEMYGTLAETTTVVSNRMIWKDGVHAGFTEPLIHMYNKSQKSVGAALENAVLVGDSLGDSTMADGAPAGPAVALKIGYLNAEPERRRCGYARLRRRRAQRRRRAWARCAVCGAIVAPAASSQKRAK